VTPDVAVSGKGSGRVSLAGVIAVRPGFRTRLIYRAIVHHGRKAARRLAPTAAMQLIAYRCRLAATS
jgi:hypothetical protein